MDDDNFYNAPTSLDFLYTGERANFLTSCCIEMTSKSASHEFFFNMVRASIRLGQSKHDISYFKTNNAYRYSAHFSMLVYKELLAKLWTDYPEAIAKLASHSFRTETDPHLWVSFP